MPQVGLSSVGVRLHRGSAKNRVRPGKD